MTLDDRALLHYRVSSEDRVADVVSQLSATFGVVPSQPAADDALLLAVEVTDPDRLADVGRIVLETDPDATPVNPTS